MDTTYVETELTIDERLQQAYERGRRDEATEIRTVCPTSGCSRSSTTARP